MNENHQGYLNNLLSESSGLETSLTQISGLVKQTGEMGDDEKHDMYRREFTQQSLKRQDLISKIEKVKEETAELTGQQQSDLETAWLNIKDSVQSMLDCLIPKR